ncbi:hypothetical protein [Pseudonocardia broussonetiae]|uniref:Uncharacterized protein n=1 Tax=Pseudonocardia broussonetiae TaxID=2736640 RepID=A0A6M6JLJ2_9PSEU|nr:hypothetical protein [Pseudonocardia broussonetiae]QJY47930.1 hypothetical protein HOP40_20780 [Pseudonocardia broussonetiae]
MPSRGDDVRLALQGPERGYLVSDGSAAVFGRSTLAVEALIPLPEGAEVPVGIETVGGPYLVYRQAGTVIRLAVPPVSVLVGGSVRRPTAADDGTVWLHRSGSGDVCRLARDAAMLDCVARYPADRPGDLTAIGADAAFVDLAADTVTVLTADGPGRLDPLGVDLPADALIADHVTTGGLLPVVDPGRSELVLVPVDGSAAVVRAPLPTGGWAAPVAAGSATVVLDPATGTVVSFDERGTELARETVADTPAETGLFRGGDGHVYLDAADGGQTVVVSRDTGAIRTVDTAPGDGSVAGADPDIPVPPVAPPSPSPTTTPSEPPVPDTVLADAPEAPVPPVGEVLVDGPAPDGPAEDGTPEDGPAEDGPAEDGPAEGGDVGGEQAVVPPEDDEPEPADPQEPAPPQAAAEAAPADAPTGLQTAVGARTAAGVVPVDLTWDQPDLGGGRLVRYEVLVDGAIADRVGVAVARLPLDDACATTDMAVRAVTAGTDGAEIVGATAAQRITPLQGDDCAPPPRQITAVAGTGAAITVTVLDDDTGEPPTECVVLLDGAVAGAIDCAGQATVQAPEYDTTYAVLVRSANAYGTSTGPAVQITTGADPTPPAQPVQEIAYRISSQSGTAESLQIGAGGSVSQPFTNSADVITTIGVIVGVDPDITSAANHRLRIQLLRGGQVLGGGEADSVDNEETRIDVGQIEAVPGETYVLRVTNLSQEIIGVYVNDAGAPSQPANVATNLGAAQAQGAATAKPLSGIVLGLKYP